MLLPAAAASLVVFSVWTVVLLRFRWRGRGRWSLVVAIALIGGVPLGTPHLPEVVRPAAAALAIAMSMKAVQLQAGLAPPAALQRVPHFLLWFLLPPATEHVPLADARAEVRRQGVRRWLRGFAKAGALLALILLEGRHVWPWPFRVWAGAFEIYFILSGLADLLTGLTCLLGFATAEVFAAPFLARSPADFWGRRWNLFVSGFLRRHVFARSARGGHVYRAAFAVFGISGLAHEYFVFVSVGARAYEPGFMLAFFGLQAVAVIAGAWGRAHLTPARFAPVPMKVALHWLWLAVTAPLFIWPIRSVLDAVELPIRAAFGL